MARVNRPTPAAAASKDQTAIEVIRAFIEKAIGHGLVADEDEKELIEQSLEVVEAKFSK